MSKKPVPSAENPDVAQAEVGYVSPAVIDDTKLLTRGDVCARLGISKTECRRREDAGKLPIFKFNALGWPLFDPALFPSRDEKPVLTRKQGPQSKYTPDEAAAVFKALDDGKNLRQCVVECKVLPDIVELIAQAWRRLDADGGIYLTRATVDVINALPLEGEFPIEKEEGILQLLTTAAADLCSTCKVRARVFCKLCMHKEAVTKAKTGVLDV